MLNDVFWFVLPITYRETLIMLWNLYFPDWTKQWKITVPEKGNQRGTFSNLLSSNRFIEIHRLKSIILVPPRGNFKSVTHQRIYGKVPEVPLFLNSYIENFSPSHKKIKIIMDIQRKACYMFLTYVLLKKRELRELFV